jgi:hypothetical protein
MSGSASHSIQARPRWRTTLNGPDCYLIERKLSPDHSAYVVCGSIVRLSVNTWRTEVLWAAEGGDIVAEFPGFPQALAFVTGVEEALARCAS